MYAMNIYAAGKDVGCFGKTECGKIATVRAAPQSDVLRIHIAAVTQV